MINRHATAVWNGSGKEGSGHLTSTSTVLNQTPYSFNTRFGDVPGTNPEELVAAAHAGCFAMKLSFVLGCAGFTPESLDAKCTISLDPAQGAVVKSHIVLNATIPGISQEQFAACVADAEKNCPISKLLNAEISVDATLA